MELEVEVPVTYKRQPCGDNPFCSNQTAYRVLRLTICYKFLVAVETCGCPSFSPASNKAGGFFVAAK